MTDEKIKKELYCSVEEIGKQKIQKDITSSIQSSQKYIDLLMSKCIDRLISAERSSDYESNRHLERSSTPFYAYNKYFTIRKKDAT